MKQRFFEENHPFQLIIQIGLNYLRGVHICGGGGGGQPQITIKRKHAQTQVP